ncbi:metal ABC transporter ATP-binding protein [Alicyclobacillus kakegawensis]|uniref:metal ABC transporter ATP-binding protein n=1 Tax=Alicyclobacillus kakegawensis TaxID=392012 RepID=UPI00082D3E8A|nr:ABC transporter ATP-binding protein [Alicyclobacillus kakegawensis]
MGEAKPVLDVRDVHVHLQRRLVLSGVRFQIQAGEFVGLIGPNGAGKTTLLKTILGLLTPAQGQILMDNRPIRRGNPAIGYVPQKVHLDPDIPLRGRDFVALGLDGVRWGVPLPRRSRRERVQQALASVRALAYADAPVGRLSGGELQRLQIAQALVGEPRLLLVDEPLSNLDIRNTHEVVRLLRYLARERGVAILLVAHDLNPLLSALDKVVYLARGRSMAGRADEVMTSESLSRLYGYPVEVMRVQGRIVVVGSPDVHVVPPDATAYTSLQDWEVTTP